VRVPPVARWPGALWRLLNDLREQYLRDGAGDIAAGVTFWLLLSIPAGILAMVSALGWLGDIVGADLATQARADAVDVARRIFAEEADAVVEAIDDLFAQPNPGLLTTSIAVAVFSLSRGFAGLIRGLDRAYDVDDRRTWLHQRLVALGLSLGSLATVAATVALQVGMVAFLPDPWSSQPMRWLSGFAILVLWAATIYHAAPFHRTPWRYDLPGAVLAAIVWALVSAGYQLYIGFAGTGNEVLAGIGAAVLALTWLYVIVLVLVVGAELNAVLARRAGVVQDRQALLDVLRSPFRNGDASDEVDDASAGGVAAEVQAAPDGVAEEAHVAPAGGVGQEVRGTPGAGEDLDRAGPAGGQPGEDPSPPPDRAGGSSGSDRTSPGRRAGS
jgi:membrane protein